MNWWLSSWDYTSPDMSWEPQECINLSIDNQATIKTMDNNCPQLAQYLIDKIKNDINRLHEEEKAKLIRQNMMD